MSIVVELVLAYVSLGMAMLALAGMAICAEYRWVYRSEYLLRLETLNRDHLDYQPYPVPTDLGIVPLY